MHQNPYLSSAKKRSFDIAVASAALPAYAASYTVAALLPGQDTITRHKRTKPNHELFEIPKLNFNGSPTISRLAITSGINELPQITNILEGDMSVVGPRPLTPEGLEEFIAALPHTLRAEWLETMPTVKPGLVSTFGLAAHCKLTKKDRARMDIYDAKKASLRNDCGLLLQLGKVCRAAIKNT